MSRHLWAGLLVVAGLGGAVRGADDAKQAALTPADAGRAYEIQGEYSASFERDGQEHKIGVQIIAQGEGKFHAVGFLGGLPGDGWNGEPRIETDGQLENGNAVFKHEEVTATATGDALTVVNGDGQQVIELKKVHRKSPTLGAKPPEGAVVLFDAETKINRFPNSKVSDEGWLIQGVTSEPQFQDCTVHIEFLLSYMPQARGQGRANSGCYVQGRFEVQILDSFGLSGENNECGGIYTISAPSVNMCFPPLAWQTYDIDFTAAKFDGDGKKTADARMTVRHNGVVIQKDVKVDHATRAAPRKEGPEPGPIYLQNHGNPIRFRNIWVVPKS